MAHVFGHQVTPGGPQPTSQAQVFGPRPGGFDLLALNQANLTGAFPGVGVPQGQQFAQPPPATALQVTQPVDISAAAQQQAQAPPQQGPVGRQFDTIGGPLPDDELDPATEISRARLGGRSGIPVSGGGASFPINQAAPLGGVARGRTGDVLSGMGLQQQQDVARQQAAAASALGSLLGGGGSLGAAAIG